MRQSPHEHHSSTRYPPAGSLRHCRYHPGHRYPQHLASTAKRWPLGPVFDHRAIDCYRTLSILLQVAGWLAFLACLYTLQAGKAARRFYEAEWAAEANALALRIDNALAKPLHWRIAPLDGGATLPQADALPQDSLSNPAPDRVVAFSDHAIAIHPDQVQTVINSTRTLTNKLRTLVNLQWRHSNRTGECCTAWVCRSARRAGGDRGQGASCYTPLAEAADAGVDDDDAGGDRCNASRRRTEAFLVSSSV
ncbi:MAG: hypothetical protein EA368_13100 [Leptolyngbya sp. DLM2.Bin27]|nr:MAG: hypothetical protein EA368_13100 [Leptolyngbya sp. DLM2.Bin27]